MSPLQRQFDQHWTRFRTEPRVLIACSGGPDSVALLRLLQAAHLPSHGLTVAHFNHHLRGAESDRDGEFVQTLCRQWDLDCQVGHADPLRLQDAARGEGLESAARHLRYTFLVQIAEQCGARYLVTGHTADDQVETVLQQVLRGSGLAGLAGMPSVRPLSPAVTLVRPLLRFHRAQLLTYLHDLGQTYRHDEHNRQRQFLRSRIRNELLPQLETDYYPGVRDALLKLSRIASEAQDLIQELAEELLDRCLAQNAARANRLDCRPLQQAPEHLCREALVRYWHRQAWPLKDMTFNHWQQIAALARGRDVPRFINLPAFVRVQRDGDDLIVERHACPDVGPRSPVS